MSLNSLYVLMCHSETTHSRYQPTFIDVCVKAGGADFEHMLKWTTCQILVFVIITVNVSWQWKLQVAVDYSVRNWKYGIEYLYSHNFGENIFFKFRIVAGCLPYKSRNFSIKILYSYREIAFCPVGYFNLSHPVETKEPSLLGFGSVRVLTKVRVRFSEFFTSAKN